MRVTQLALRIAEDMGCPKRDLESLKIAGVLHDLGKISIPDSVLLKPGRLTNEEFETIKSHSVAGEDILKPIALFEKERKIIRHHHERWDGRGYPDGLSADSIPLLSRVLAVADTFDAITNNRPYRLAQGPDVAVQEIEKNRGLQFDGSIVDHFMNII